MDAVVSYVPSALHGHPAHSKDAINECVEMLCFPGESDQWAVSGSGGGGKEMAGHPEHRRVSDTSGSHCYSGQSRAAWTIYDHLYIIRYCAWHEVRAWDITLPFSQYWVQYVQQVLDTGSVVKTKHKTCWMASMHLCVTRKSSPNLNQHK